MKKFKGNGFACLNRGMSKVKFAFTLAEVLIVITIIGVVAAMTLPTLLDVSQEKVWNTSAEVFETKMYQALKMMNVKNELARLDSTEDFVANLERNMKITKKCDNEHLDECFTKKISIMQGKKATKPKNLSGEGGYNLTTSDNLGHADWETNVMGLQFPNGITALLAYNAVDCMPRSNSQDALTNCIAMIYDVNANGDPNTVKMDIRTMNAPVLGSTCTDYAAGFCIALVSSPETGLDCTSAENIEACNFAGSGCYNPTASTTDNFYSYYTNNKVAVIANVCNSMGMHLVKKNELTTIVDALGQTYMAQIAQENGNGRWFVTGDGCAWNRASQFYDVVGNSYYNSYHGSNYPVNGAGIVGMCVKAESN